MQGSISIRRMFTDRWHHLPIGRQLLLVVSSILAMFVLTFLAYDYRVRMKRHLDEKRIALTEEAKTLYESILFVQPNGSEGIQDLVDNVCARMNTSDSPGHHIAVEWNGWQFQAKSHGHASQENMAAMHAAAGTSQPNRSLKAQTLSSGISATQKADAIVLGQFEGLAGTVYISERRSAVVNATRRSLAIQMIAVLAIGVIAAVVANVVLRQLIAKPIQGFVRTLKSVASGDLSVNASTRSCMELRYLAEQMNMMTQSLNDAAIDHRVHMEKARQIQQHLLPKPKKRPGIEVAELFEPAAEVGGDYFDVVSLADDRYLLCLADVTGHGVPAAMAATVIKSLVLEAIQFSENPAEILTRINRRYIEIIMPGHFATMVVLVVDTVKCTVSYANAGHEPPFIQRPGGKVERLLEGGLVLGIDESETYTEELLPLERGTRLVVVSDGVTEAFDPADKQFGSERVAGTMAESRCGTVYELVECFVEKLKQFRKSRLALDDTTLLVAELVS